MSAHSTRTTAMALRPPRPIWMFVGTVILILVGVTLRFGVPLYQQQMQIDRVNRLGGKVTIESGLPKWLEERVPKNWAKRFGNVIVVRLEGCPIDDADLKGLRHFPQLRSLVLRDTAVNDDNLVHVRGLSHLRTLSLGQTHVSDSGVANIAGLSQLEWLSLSETRVSDRCTQHLAGLTRLKLLGLNSTSITDDGLRNLTGLVNLQGIAVQKTTVTDTGVTALKRAVPNVDVIR